jgi:hypothetical protein
MTDYDKFVSLMNEFDVGIGVTELEGSPVKYIVSMREGDKNIRGCPGYGAEFNFSADGSFHTMGAYDTKP